MAERPATGFNQYLIELLEPRCLFSAGQVDPTFGNGGIIQGVSGLFPGGAGHAMVVQPDGRIVIGGGSGQDELYGDLGPGAQSDFAVARLMLDGSLDPTFGNGGRVTLNTGNALSSINGLALQSDGKIIAVGFGGSDVAHIQLAVARFDSNGQIDSTFGDNGLAFPSASLSEGFGVAVQPDGKIVIAAQGGLLRLTSSGALDGSFGQQGIAAPTIRNIQLVDDAVVMLEPGGKIVVGGDSGFPGPPGGVASVSRFNASGVLDPTFGTSGVATVNQLGPMTGLAVEPDGKIVGSAALTGHMYPAMAAVRFTSGGQLDKTFANGGIFTTTFRDPTLSPPARDRNGIGSAVALQSDGKVVVGGYLALGDLGVGLSGADFAAVRLTSSGELDSTFGNSGKVVTDDGGMWTGDLNVSQAIAVTSRGILLAGSAEDVGEPPSNGDFAILRYTLSGQLDLKFGDHGRVGPDPAFPGLLQALAVQPNGDLLATGEGRVFLARFASTGTLDPSFGIKGRYIDQNDTALSSDQLTFGVNAMAELSDGDVLVAGNSAIGGAQGRIVLWRFRSNGTLDSGFGNGGIRSLIVNRHDPSIAYQVLDMVQQPDGKSILSVAFNSMNPGSELIRINSDGTLDRSFGRHGIVSTPASFTTMNIGADGRFLASGTSPAFSVSQTTPTILVIARYGKNGAPDSSFGTSGQVTMALSANGSAGAIEAINNGEILAAGADSDGFFITRFDAAGKADIAFGVAGILHVANSPAFGTEFPAIDVDSEGRFDVSGSAFVTSAAVPAIARFNADGSLDTSFGEMGVSALAALAGGAINSVVTGPDGSMFVSAGIGLAKLEG